MGYMLIKGIKLINSNIWCWPCQIPLEGCIEKAWERFLIENIIQKIPKRVELGQPIDFDYDSNIFFKVKLYQMVSESGRFWSFFSHFYFFQHLTLTKNLNKYSF